jgi:hypothetical protein
VNRIVTAAAVAVATTAVSWAVRRWLDRHSRSAPARRSLESWENEGGATAPRSATMQTSQVPR